VYRENVPKVLALLTSLLDSQGSATIHRQKEGDENGAAVPERAEKYREVEELNNSTVEICIHFHILLMWRIYC
jgi:hypothetical protein